MENTENISQIVRAGADEYFKKKIIICNINVSDICNLSCSYCINRSYRSRRVLDKQLLTHFIADIAERECDLFYFNVAGGEPLLYPHVVCLVEKIAAAAQRKATIHFATNASLLPAIGDRLYAAAGETRLEFYISVHPGQIDHMAFAERLANFGHRDALRCKLLLQHNKLEENERLAAILRRAGIFVFAGAITRPDGRPEPYSAAELLFIKDNPPLSENIFEIMRANGMREHFNETSWRLFPEKMDFYGMYCMAGMSGLRLNPGGMLVPCFGAYSFPEKMVFDLRKRRLKDIPELNKPCVCHARRCSCAPFLMLPKWRGQRQPAYYSASGQA